MQHDNRAPSGGAVAFDERFLARAVESLPQGGIDLLPFGAIRLDAQGVVQVFNKTEAEQSGYGARPSVGMSFFTDIAPCMNNDDFHGRIKDAIGRGTLDIEFGHIGDFDDRDKSLRVRVQSAQDGGYWIFIEREE